MTARRLCAAAAVLAAAAPALAGCGEDRSRADGTQTEARPEPPPPLAQATFAISEREYRLSPGGARLTRPAAVEIHVANDGRRRHALAVDAPAGEVRTGPLAPGGSAVLTAELTRPGRYAWYCPLGNHRSRGMRGAIVVVKR